MADSSREPPSIDLNARLGLEEYRVTLVPPEDQEEAKHRRRKDLLLFVFALLSFGILEIYRLVLAVADSSSADEKKWAQTILASTASAVSGYLMGKGVK